MGWPRNGERQREGALIEIALLTREVVMEEMRSVLKNTLGKTLQTFPVEDRLEAVWRVICGKALAEHGRVMGYSDGVLRVEVNDEAWMEQMKSLRSEIESGMARIAGVRVRGIHFEMTRQKKD